MTREEALGKAWSYIFEAGSDLAHDETPGEYYTEEDWPEIYKAILDIVRHPTEYTAYIE